MTVVIQVLEGHKLNKATRGHVRVLCREGLIEAAQGSYGVPKAEYVRLLGASPDKG